jgi:hypothetical protein
MATLDVSDVLLCEEFTDDYVIKRASQSTDDHGRVVETEQSIDSFGVVTTASGSDLQRYPDMQLIDRVLSIVTKTRLQSATKNNSADIIIWRGNNYVVKYVDPYPQYGQGFYQVIVASIDLMDEAI